MTVQQSAVRNFKGHSPQLGARVFIDSSAVVIGNVVLGDDTSVWPQVAIRGDMHKIRIGTRTSVQDGCVLHITHAGPYNDGGWPLIIGDNVTIGHNVTLHGCTIGDEVLIGMGAIVMDGAQVANRVVIAAGALATPGKTLRSGFLYGGSPAREMRELTAREIDYFVYSANNYVNLKNQYLTEALAK